MTYKYLQKLPKFLISFEVYKVSLLNMDIINFTIFVNQVIFVVDEEQGANLNQLLIFIYQVRAIEFKSNLPNGTLIGDCCR